MLPGGCISCIKGIRRLINRCYREKIRKRRFIYESPRLPKYIEHFGVLVRDGTQAPLGISPAAIDRIFKPVRIQCQKIGKSATKPGTLLRKQIPVDTNQREEWRLFHSFFLPSVKLIEKERIGSKTIKTPHQRTMESQCIPQKTKDAPVKQLELLNPFELRNIMEMKLKKITRLRQHRL